MPCIGAVGKRRLSADNYADEQAAAAAAGGGRLQMAPSDGTIARPTHVSAARSQTSNSSDGDFRGSAIVELHRRDGGDLGLVLTGGADRETPPRVAYLKPGGIAQRSDALEVGDYVISINGESTAGLKHSEVANLLQNCSVGANVFEIEYILPDPQQMSFSILCKRIEVVLVRDASGTFGMTLRGGASIDPGKCRPLTVTQIRPNGSADRSVFYLLTGHSREGTLKVGDRVLAANGVSLMQRSLSQALNFLRDVPDDEVAFLVEYDVSVLEVVQNATGPLLVEIDKLPGNPLGITLAHGHFRGRLVLFIDSVTSASIADRCGALHVGDHVLSVDGVVFDEELPVSEATRIVAASSGSQVQLEIVPAALVRSETKPVPVPSIPAEVEALTDEMANCVPALPMSLEPSLRWNDGSGRLFSSVSMNSVASSALSHGTCASMTTQVGSAVAKYGACNGVGTLDRTNMGSLDRPGVWDSLGRRSTISGNSLMLSCSQATQVCHLDTTEVMLFADQHRRALGGAAAYGLVIDPGGAVVPPQNLLMQPPVVAYVEPKGSAERCGVIQEGDHIIAINGQYLEGRTMDEVEAFVAESPVKMLLLIEFRVAESIIPSSGVFVVKLAKRGAGLGITISCPRNRRPGQHLIISDVKKGSVAHRTGSIQPGDQLLAIDNVRLDNCTLEDSARVLQDTHDIVKLTIKKDENFADEPDPTHLITYTVELPKFAGPLGITISGSEEPFDPVFISSLTDDGLAQKTGALHVGDRLLAINGVSLRGKTLTDAVHLLQNAGDTVTLKITRPATTRTQTSTTCNNNGGKCYDSMDSALESWDSSGLDGINTKVNHKSHLREPRLFDGSSSNDSNNSATNKDNNSNSTTDHVTLTATRDGVTTSLSDQTVGSPAAWNANSPPASAPPSCGSGSVDDEWSRQMDELDRLRPTVAFSDNCTSEHLVVDSFNDLPDIVIDDDLPSYKEVVATCLQPLTVTPSGHDVLPCANNARAESGIIDCDRMSTVSDITTADLHLREVEEQLENIFTPTPIELLKVTLRRRTEADDFGFSLSDGVFEKGVYVGAIRPGGPAAGALRPYDRLLQVNNIRTKDLDCCQVVPLIVQATGKEVHLVISRNPLVWGSTDVNQKSIQLQQRQLQQQQQQQQQDPMATIVRSKQSLRDGDRGVVR